MDRRLPLALALIVLAACSQPDPGEAPASTHAAAATTAPAPHPPAATAPAVTSTDKAFEAYQAPDHDPARWMGLCAAVTGTAADAKVVAEQTDAAYKATTDAFAKRDALAAVQARLDRATAEGKANPYVRLPIVLTRMPDYDVDHGYYPLAALIGAGQGMHVTDGNARVTYAANPGLVTYAPPEAEARSMEQTLSTNPLARRIDMEVYGKVTGCTLMSGSPALTVTPTRIALANHFVNGHTTPLFTATTTP